VSGRWPTGDWWPRTGNAGERRRNAS